MKPNLSVKLFLLFLVLAVLTACTPSEGVFEVDVQPASDLQQNQAVETTPELVVGPAPLEDAKAIALAILGGSITNVMEYVELITIPCTTLDGLGGPPQCTEGEPEGTEVTVFPLGGAEGSFVRQDDIEESFAFNLTVKNLYAVYNVTPSPQLESYIPPGEIALLFEREVNDFPVPVTALIQDGKLVGLNFAIGVSSEDILKEIPVADILVAPQEVDAWLGLPDSLIPTRPAEDTSAPAQEEVPAPEDVSEPEQDEAPVPTESDTVITSSRTAGSNPGWDLYTVPALGYSFELPETWRVDESHWNESFHGIYVYPPDSDPNLVYLFVATDSRGIEEVETIYRDSSGQVAPYFFAGQNGFQVTYTDYPRIEFLIPYKDTVIVLGTDEHDMPEIQLILESFQISLPAQTDSTPVGQEPAPEEIAFEDLPALVMAASQPETLFTSVSPDGNWQADIIRYDCVLVDPASGSENAYEQLIITHLSDGVKTVSAEQLQYCGGMGSYGFNDLYWSNSSQYYYFDEVRVFSGPDGMACGLLNTGFSRINVETSVREYLPGNGTVFIDNGILVGWTDQQIVLTLLDGDEIRRTPFAIQGYTLQSMQMSPAGARFAYTLSESCDPAQGNTAIVLYNLADNSQTILAESAASGYRYAQWESPTQLMMLDTNGYQWLYNLETGELTGPNMSE